MTETPSTTPQSLAIRRYLTRPFSWIYKLSKTTIIVGSLLFALGLNVASVTIGPVFMAMSALVDGAASLVTKKPVTQRKLYEGRLAGQRKRIDDLTHVKFKGKKVPVRRAVRDTTTGISKRIAKATARSTSSVFAESIPYVGIAVVAGVTALEVSDACDTMKDLQELERAFDPSAVTDENTVCGQEVPTKNEIIDYVRTSPGKAWDKAKNAVPNVPSWDDTMRSAKEVWWELLEWLNELFGF